MLATSSSYRFSVSLIAAAASWGVATVISKRALEEIPPLALLPIQLGASVFALTVLLFVQRVKVRWSKGMGTLAWLGVLNPGVSYALGLAGLSQITASMSVLLWAVEPLLILGLAASFLKEPITRRLASASVVALVGVFLVGSESSVSGRVVGVGLTLAGVAACAIYTVAVRKLTIDATMAALTVQHTAALLFALLLLGGAVALNASVVLPRASGTAWTSAVVSGVLYYSIAFWFYLTGLKHVAASIAGGFLNLIPLFGIASGYLLLGERLTGRQWIGALLIVAAVVTLFRPKSAGVSNSSDSLGNGDVVRRLAASSDTSGPVTRDEVDGPR